MSTGKADAARQREINERVSTLLQYAGSVMVARKSECLAAFELTPTQYTAMLMLRCNPGIATPFASTIIDPRRDRRSAEPLIY